MKKETTAPETKKPTKKDELILLRKELESERAKNEVLSIQLAKKIAALDANARAREARIEADMICIVNTNAANQVARKKRAAAVYARNSATKASYVRACTTSAILLGIDIAAAAAVIIAGQCGVIDPVVATAFSFVLLPAAGWGIRDCSLLHKFTDFVKG